LDVWATFLGREKENGQPFEREARARTKAENVPVDPETLLGDLRLPHGDAEFEESTSERNKR
jgi:hypothetical protein